MQLILVNPEFQQLRCSLGNLDWPSCWKPSGSERGRSENWKRKSRSSWHCKQKRRCTDLWDPHAQSTLSFHTYEWCYTNKRVVLCPALPSLFIRLSATPTVTFSLFQSTWWIARLRRTLALSLVRLDCPIRYNAKKKKKPRNKTEQRRAGDNGGSLRRARNNRNNDRPHIYSRKKSPVCSTLVLR